MSLRTGTSLVLALALAAALAPSARAGERLRRAPERPVTRSAAITISGRLSGTIAREVTVNGTAYHVAPDARIYESGVGFVRPGVSYFDRVATFSVVMVRGVPIVRSVLVRPATWPSDQPAGGVMDENSPR